MTTISRTLQVIPSDRSSLVDNAVTTIHVLRQGRDLSEPFSSKEQETYEAALDYLKEQFLVGHKETDVYETSVTKEQT